MFWLGEIAKGVGYGLAIGVLSFGPSFFTLIHTGMQGGRGAGLRLALGIFLSEFTVAAACYFGLADLFTLPWVQVVFSGVATAAIAYLGLRGWFTRYPEFARKFNEPVSTSTNVFKGYILNLFNPFVLVLWVSLMGTITVGTDYLVHPRLAIAVQMASILLTLFSLDLGKVYLSDFLGRKLNLRLSFFINRYFGLLMVALGVYFAVQFVRVLWPLLKTL